MGPGVWRGLTLVVVAVVLLPSTTGLAASAPPSVDGIAFESAHMVAERGDVAAIDVRGEPGSTTRITIRGSTTTYHHQTAVVDENRDGEVTLLMNTHTAGRADDPATVFSAAGDDRLAYVNRVSRSRSEPLPSGRYNVIAGNQRTSVAAELRLVDGSVTGATIHSASPGTAPDSTGGTIGTVPARDREIVGGDTVVMRFDVGGIGALLDDPPSENVVVPADSAPGAATTHTVALTAPENGTLRTVTIDYSDGDGGIPQSVLARTLSSVTVVGVDSNGDGILDRESVVDGRDIEISTTIGGEVTLAFGESPRLNASETLYLRLPIRNPSITGPDRINVERNGEELANADRIVYGPAGAGSLGYGVDFRMDAPNATVVDPTAGIDYRYDDASNSLVVTAPTDGLHTGRTYGVGLRLLEEYPYGDDSGTAVDFTVAYPQARLLRPTGTFDDREPRRFRVIATTNLAPGSEVAIEMTAENGSGGASFTTVTPSQQINQSVTIPERVRGSSVLIVIKHDNRTISSPVLVEYS